MDNDLITQLHACTIANPSNPRDVQSHLGRITHLLNTSTEHDLLLGLITPQFVKFLTMVDGHKFCEKDASTQRVVRECVDSIIIILDKNERHFDVKFKTNTCRGVCRRVNNTEQACKSVASKYSYTTITGCLFHKQLSRRQLASVRTYYLGDRVTRVDDVVLRSFQ